MKKVEIVPLEVIIRNFSAGSFAKKMGMEEGIKFKQPTLEFSYKNDDLGIPSSTATMPWLWAWPRRKRLTPLRNMRSSSTM